MTSCHLSPTFIFCKASVQPGYDTVDGKHCRLFAFYRTVEDRPIDQLAGVVCFHSVGRFWRGSGTRLDHSIKHPAGQALNSLDLLVPGNELLALDAVLVAFLLILGGFVLVAAARFDDGTLKPRAVQLMAASLFYLPLVLALLALDGKAA